MRFNQVEFVTHKAVTHLLAAHGAGNVADGRVSVAIALRVLYADATNGFRKLDDRH